MICRRLLTILAAMSLAACAAPPSAPMTNPSRRLSTESTPSVGTVRITQTEDMSGGAYIEGYVASAQAIDASGTEVFDVEVPYRDTITRDLQPDTYRLVFEVRPCDANCGTLDPVDERCSSPFDVLSGETTQLSVVVRPGHGCQVTVG